MSDWHPDLSVVNGRSKHAALTEALVAAIGTGELPHGARLPPHRDLAHRLGLSVQTVSASYQEVQRRGLIRSVVGRGSFVAAGAPERAGSFIQTPGSADEIDLSIVQLTYSDAHERAARAAMAEMAEADNGQWMRPARPVAGLPRHREAAALWLEPLGAAVRPERVFVTNGATQGIFLALAAVARPGDLVLTERLTENGIIGAAGVLGLTLRGLETDDEGIRPDALEAALARGGVAAVVWVPTFGNPTGHLAGAERRAALAAIAARHRVPVIEDEVYKPLLEERLPSIVELMPDAGFLVTGFSKSVMTGLRVGYLVVPGPFALRVAAILRATTWSGPPALAELATRWLEDGTTRRLTELQRAEARARHGLLAATLGAHVARAHPLAPSAWLRVPPGWTEAALASVLRDRRILVTPSAPFTVDPDLPEPGIRICTAGPYGRETLKGALDIIAEVFAQLPAIEGVVR